MSALLKLNGDGSGTIVTRTIILSSASDRLRLLFAAFGDDPADHTDIRATSNESARRVADRLGITFVSSTPIRQTDGGGAETTFTFTDINKLDLAGLLAGLIESDGYFSAASEPLSMELRGTPSGSAVLRAHVAIWEPADTVALPPAPNSNQALERKAENAFVLDLLRGARFELAIEPNGTIVRTNSPYVEKGRVTVVDLEPERLVSDEVEMKMAGARTEEEKRAVLADAAGAKIALAPEVTIEFTPF